MSNSTLDHAKINMLYPGTEEDGELTSNMNISPMMHRIMPLAHIEVVSTSAALTPLHQRSIEALSKPMTPEGVLPSQKIKKVGKSKSKARQLAQNQ